MDSRSLKGNLYEAFALQNTEMPPDTKTTTESLEENGHRQTTDKNWSWFFLVILICWTTSLQYAVIHYPTEHDVLSDTINGASKNISHEIVFENSMVAKNLSKLAHAKINNETNLINERDRIIKEEKWSILFYFFFDAITCRPVNLADKAVIWTYPGVFGFHALFGLFYYAGSLISINDNEVFSKQPSIFGATLAFVALSEHIFASSSVAFSLQPVQERLTYWVVPEALLLVFCLSKIVTRAQSEEKNPLLPLPFYVFAIAVGIPVFVVLELLIAATVQVAYNLSWNNILFYVIIGGSCYVGSTIYYFGLMVVSCAMCVLRDGTQSLWKYPFRALFIVARYHFGTVCYQATLLFPKSYADREVKEVAKFLERNGRRIRKPKPKRTVPENSRKKKEKESRLTYWDIYSEPITLTAVYGTDYSRSLRRLLHFWCTDALSKEYIYDYRYLIRDLSLHIITTNSFMIILLWFLGLDDSTFTLATWLMYIKIMAMYYLAMQYFKATSDAIVFCVYRKLEGIYGDIPAEKLRINYAWVPNTKVYEVRIKLT